MTSAIEIERLDVRYDSFRALENISFTAEPGEMVTLLGPSGCGKSTLLRIVAGLLGAHRGRITIGEKVVTDVEAGISVPPDKRNLGMVFQSYAIWPHMSVADNVAYPLKVRKVPRPEIERRLRNTLDLVGLSALADRRATEVSGGQQQRIAIARALVFDPNVLLLDEPLSNLDSKLRERMGFELKRIQRRAGVTSLYVTHDQTEALALSDRIVVLDRGQVQQIGAPEIVYESPVNPFVSWFIGRTNFIPGKVRKLAADAEVEIVKGGKPLRCRLSQDRIEVGDDVVISMRPEEVTITANAADAIIGTIVSSSFQGDRCLHAASVNGAPVAFFTDRAQRFSIGDIVKLLLPPRVGIIFRESYKPSPF